MMSMREDPRFSAALEECCGRVRRGEPLEQCVGDYPPEYREELARLVPLAFSLSRLARDPSPEFQARLELRLQAAVDETRRAQRSGPLGWIGRFFASAPLARTAAIVLVVVALIAGGGLGVDQAAASSLPDDPLYQVKTAREWVQLALARAPEAQVDVRANQIAERGTEMERAIRAGKPVRILDVLLVRLARTTRQMVDQALEREARGNRQPAIRALAVIRAMETRLDRLIPQASPEVRPALQRMGGFLREQERRLLVRGPRVGRGAGHLLLANLPQFVPDLQGP